MTTILMRRLTFGLLLGVVLAFTATEFAYGVDAKGKISKNIYRFPYEDGVDVTVTNDYVTHGSAPSAQVGPYDMVADAADRVLVAMADGRVTRVFDLNNDCGCDGAYGPCANSIRIQHANGERSTYLHIKKNSAMVDTGDCVVAGQPIAVEGDVGWTCGSGRSATADVCLDSVPAGAGDCGRHLHFDVVNPAMDERMVPIICNIPNNFMFDGQTYSGTPCNPGICPNWSIQNFNVSGFGNVTFRQALDSLVSDATTIADSASVVLHAGHRVVLRPPFTVSARGYFRAEIGGCNDTPEAGCPPPSPTMFEDAALSEEDSAY